MNGPRRVLIIGGGFTGLTAAYRLSADPGLRVTLLERSPNLGGLAGGFAVEGTSLEKGYHHLFRSDRHIQELVDELGLADRLMWCESSMSIYQNGRLHPFMSPMDLLRFRPCGILGRLRVGLVALYLQKRKDWRPFLQATAFDWMSRAVGADAMRAIWEPLLRGKFDVHYDKVSMAWLWARIHVRANSRDPGGGKERLGYFRGGFEQVTRKLESELLRRGARVETRAEILRLLPDEKAAELDGRRESFDACVFTGPCPAFARLLPAGERFAAYARQLESIHYIGAICLVFVSDQDLGGPYWVNVNEADAPFLVCIQHTRLVDWTLYGSHHVYYLGAYRPHTHPAFTEPEPELTGAWWAYLKRIFPQFDPGRVRESHLFRLRHAQHIADVGYPERIPEYRTPVPGVYLANFAQVFPEDRGTNFAVREGNKIARLVSGDLKGARERGGGPS